MKKLSQKRLADTILNGRKQKGLTQQKLAELTGINRTMLSHMETEEYRRIYAFHSSAGSPGFRPGIRSG